MKIFLDFHTRFLSDLIQEQVEFLIVGGYAVIYHGYVRTTGDMDIWLKPDNTNKKKLLSVLKKYAIHDESIERVRQLDFKEPAAFHFGDPPRKIDFLTKMAGLNFKSASVGSVTITSDNFTFPVLNLKDLITNKMLSGRAKDIADVEELQKIIALKSKKKK
jgi:hypothetical protein